MLKGSVQEPQCGGAHNSEPAAADRAHTHMLAHVRTSATHMPNTWIPSRTQKLHTIGFFSGGDIIVTYETVEIYTCCQ